MCVSFFHLAPGLDSTLKNTVHHVYNIFLSNLGPALKPAAHSLFNKLLFYLHPYNHQSDNTSHHRRHPLHPQYRRARSNSARSSGSICNRRLAGLTYRGALHHPARRHAFRRQTDLQILVHFAYIVGCDVSCVDHTDQKHCRAQKTHYFFFAGGNWCVLGLTVFGEVKDG
jgi:hypothetical protein